MGDLSGKTSWVGDAIKQSAQVLFSALVILSSAPAPAGEGAPSGCPYASSQKAQDAGRQYQKEADRAEECMEQARSSDDDNTREAEQLAQDIARLLAKKKRALIELSTGYYCSKCRRAASVIEEKEHESFEAHLGRVQGERRAAPAELIERTAKQFDLEIQQERSHYRQFETRHETLLARWRGCAEKHSQSGNRAAQAGGWGRYLEGIERQRAFMAAQRRLRQAEAEARQAEAAAMLRALHEQLQRQAARRLPPARQRQDTDELTAGESAVGSLTAEEYAAMLQRRAQQLLAQRRASEQLRQQLGLPQPSPAADGSSPLARGQRSTVDEQTTAELERQTDRAAAQSLIAAGAMQQAQRQLERESLETGAAGVREGDSDAGDQSARSPVAAPPAYLSNLDRALASGSSGTGERPLGPGRLALDSASAEVLRASAGAGSTTRDTEATAEGDGEGAAPPGFLAGPLATLRDLKSAAVKTAVTGGGLIEEGRALHESYKEFKSDPLGYISKRLTKQLLSASCGDDDVVGKKCQSVLDVARITNEKWAKGKSQRDSTARASKAFGEGVRDRWQDEIIDPTDESLDAAIDTGERK